MSTASLPDPIRLPSMPVWLILAVLWDAFIRMLRELLHALRYELKNAWYAGPTWVDRAAHRGRHSTSVASDRVWGILENIEECEYVVAPRGQHRWGTGYDAMRTTERARGERSALEACAEELREDANIAFAIEVANLRNAINDLEWDWINLQEWYIDRWLEHLEKESVTA